MDILTLQNAFWIIALVSTLLYILKLIIFFFIGGDSEVSSAFDSITETDTAFDFISIQSVLGFLMGFGWGGHAALTMFHAGIAQSIIIAFVCGLLIMYLYALIMSKVKKLESPVTVNLNELVDKKGRTYTSFSPKGKGQIEIDINGRLSVIDAFNYSEEEIKAFEAIKVEKVEDNSIYIKKI